MIPNTNPASRDQLYIMIVQIPSVRHIWKKLTESFSCSIMLDITPISVRYINVAGCIVRFKKKWNKLNTPMALNLIGNTENHSETGSRCLPCLCFLVRLTHLGDEKAEWRGERQTVVREEKGLGKRGDILRMKGRNKREKCVLSGKLGVEKEE